MEFEQSYLSTRQTDPVEAPQPNGVMTSLQTTVQKLGWFEKQWDVKMSENFADDYRLQPSGVQSYKDNIDFNYGNVPDDREDLWLIRRNYLINCMRLWMLSSIRCSRRWIVSGHGRTPLSSSPATTAR